MCKPRQRFMCKNDCDVCFERSFASHEKSKFWNVELNSKIVLTKLKKKIDCSSPRNITKNNNNKFWFTCPDCKHNFYARLNSVVKGIWCPYCVNKKLCNGNDCTLCFNKSFASHEKAKFWHPTKNNIIKKGIFSDWIEEIAPRQIFKGSNKKKYWFTCDKCNHDFNIMVNGVTRGHWCSYCSNKQLCNDCEECFNKSFESSEQKSCWHPTKNNIINEETGEIIKITPRQVFKNSNNKYCFTCDKCNHDFDTSLSNVTKGHWCPYCGNRKLCIDNDCKQCFDKSFISHPKSKCWHRDKNKLNPRQVFKSSDNKYWFTCPDCNHDFDTSLSNVTNGNWCPYCAKPPKKLCIDNDCKQCKDKSFSIHEKSRYWHPTKNNIINEETGKIIKITPRQVFKNSGNKFWFTCPNCNHDFDTSLSNVTKGQWCPYCANQKLCIDNDCKQCKDKSFSIHEKSRYWHPTKNNKVDDKTGKIIKIAPRQVFKNSGNKFWFTCPDCKHNFNIRLHSVTNGNWCPYCAKPQKKLCIDNDCKQCKDKSFSIHEKSRYWYPTKNNIINEETGKIIKITPRQVFKNSHNKFWFTCPDCNHDFNIMVNDVTKGRWCPYCVNKKLCNGNDCTLCFNKSFSIHEKSRYWHPTKNNIINEETGEIIKITPRQVFKNSNNKYWFTCDKCEHDFNSLLANIAKGQWCPYCGNRKLCIDNDCTLCFNKSFSIHEKSRYWHPTKNNIINEETGKIIKITPRQVFKNSNNKYCFTCPDCNHDFNTQLNNVTNGHWCPTCKNKTEKKLYEFLLTIYPEVKHQFRPDWCKNPKTGRHLPFDFVIQILKIIIELDGAQHFKQVRNWKSPEEQQSRDLYKMKKSNENGYTVIRLLQEDVWNDTNNWQEELTKMLNKKYSKPECVFISDGNEYECYLDFDDINEDFSDDVF